MGQKDMGDAVGIYVKKAQLPLYHRFLETGVYANSIPVFLINVKIDRAGFYRINIIIYLRSFYRRDAIKKHVYIGKSIDKPTRESTIDPKL